VSRRADGEAFLWKGRACKGYTKVGDRWYLILHTGLLDHSAGPGHKTGDLGPRVAAGEP
jgi:hypothetical protein